MKIPFLLSAQVWVTVSICDRESGRHASPENGHQKTVFDPLGLQKVERSTILALAQQPPSAASVSETAPHYYYSLRHNMGTISARCHPTVACQRCCCRSNRHRPLLIGPSNRTYAGSTQLRYHRLTTMHRQRSRLGPTTSAPTPKRWAGLTPDKRLERARSEGTGR